MREKKTRAKSRATENARVDKERNSARELLYAKNTKEVKRERERQGAETIKGRKTLRKRRALFPRAVDHYLSPGPLRVGCRGSGWGLRGCFFSTLVGDLRVLFFMVFHTHTHRHTDTDTTKRQEHTGVRIKTKERKLQTATQITNKLQTNTFPCIVVIQGSGLKSRNPDSSSDLNTSTQLTAYYRASIDIQHLSASGFSDVSWCSS